MGIDVLLLVSGMLMGVIGSRLGQRFWHRRSEQTQPIAFSEGEATHLNAVAPGSASSDIASSDTADLKAATVSVSEELAYYQALELAQFKGGFLARTAHELRSPLSSLMGLHQLILTDLCDSPEEERECVAQAYEAAQNFFGLLESIIEVSKFDHGSRSLKLQPLALQGVLAEVQMAVSLPFADRNVALKLSDVAEEIQIQADYDCLRQVLIQLLLLSIQHKASNVTLEVIEFVEESASQPLVGLRITDDGSGERLLETLETWKGFQLEPVSISRPPRELRHQWRPRQLSPGFSLFMQQALVEMMGGRLELQTPEQRSLDSEIESDAFAVCCWLPGV